MKKYVIYFIIFILLLFGFYKIRDLDKTPEDLTTVNVAEVTHSIFYSPWYVALENGYFEDEGLNINVVLTPGADKVMAAVLSKDVNIGFSGPEATIYVKDGGEKDYVINFAALTKRDGQFILGPCSQKDNFKVENLKGKKILVGRSGDRTLNL